MVQRYIREFPMTAVEGSLMYKLERKDIQPCKIGGEVRRFVVLHYLFVVAHVKLSPSVDEIDVLKRLNETFDLAIVIHTSGYIEVT